ncbi:MAG: hypothetical protein K2J74_02050 [Muribaculaceae bacterium]|nr:hypothetical protein [Muribaculaceae bacterium]
MKMDKEEFDSIPIPDGLEQRLSDSIDRWERRESQPRLIHKLNVACACVACFIVMLAGVSIFMPSDNMEQQPYVLADTFTDPDEAYAATVYALQQLQQGFEKGFAQLDEVNTDYEQMKEAFYEL